MIKVLSKEEGLKKMFKEEEVYVTRDFWHFYKAEECTPDTFKKRCFFVVQTKQDSFQTVNRKDLQMKRIAWEELRDVFKNLSLSLPIGENDFLIEDKEEECLDECKFIHSWGLINFTYEQISKYKARNIYKIKIKEERKK